MSAVVVNHLHLLAVHHGRVFLGDPVHHVVILLAKHGRHHGRHQGLDVTNDDALDVGMHKERPGRHTRSTGHHQHRFRLFMEQGRDVAEHALQAHVIRLARRLHLAGAMETPNPRGVVQAHRHRHVSSFTDVGAVSVPLFFFPGNVCRLDNAWNQIIFTKRQFAAKSNQPPGDRCQAPGQPDGDAYHGGQDRG